MTQRSKLQLLGAMQTRRILVNCSISRRFAIAEFLTKCAFLREEMGTLLRLRYFGPIQKDYGELEQKIEECEQKMRESHWLIFGREMVVLDGEEGANP